MSLVKKEERVFKPKYYGEKSEHIFNTTFKQVNNRGDVIELDEIIIFDGGDVYGYEKNLKDDFLAETRD